MNQAAAVADAGAAAGAGASTAAAAGDAQQQAATGAQGAAGAGSQQQADTGGQQQAAAGDAAAAAKPVVFGPDGKLGENWFLGLGDEYSAHAADLGKYKELGPLVHQLLYFQKNGVSYPGEGAQPVEVDRFRKVAGVPATADGYGLTAEALQMPAGMEFDSELATKVMDAAHKTHTPPAAVLAIAKEFNTLLGGRMEQMKQAEAQAKAAAQDDLVKAWGGDYEANSSRVRHMATKLGEAAGIPGDAPEVAQLANNPVFAKMLMEVAKLTSEDTLRRPAGFGDLRPVVDQIKAITNGTDPVWGQKYTKGNRQEKEEAYKYVKSLREKAGQ